MISLLKAVTHANKKLAKTEQQEKEIGLVLPAYAFLTLKEMGFSDKHIKELSKLDIKTCADFRKYGITEFSHISGINQHAIGKAFLYAYKSGAWFSEMYVNPKDLLRFIDKHRVRNERLVWAIEAEKFFDDLEKSGKPFDDIFSDLTSSHTSYVPASQVNNLTDQLPENTVSWNDAVSNSWSDVAARLGFHSAGSESKAPTDADSSEETAASRRKKHSGKGNKINKSYKNRSSSTTHPTTEDMQDAGVDYTEFFNAYDASKANSMNDEFLEEEKVNVEQRAESVLKFMSHHQIEWPIHFAESILDVTFHEDGRLQETLTSHFIELGTETCTDLIWHKWAEFERPENISEEEWQNTKTRLEQQGIPFFEDCHDAIRLTQIINNGRMHWNAINAKKQQQEEKQEEKSSRQISPKKAATVIISTMPQAVTAKVEKKEETQPIVTTQTDTETASVSQQISAQKEEEHSVTETSQQIGTTNAEIEALEREGVETIQKSKELRNLANSTRLNASIEAKELRDKAGAKKAVAITEIQVFEKASNDFTKESERLKQEAQECTQESEEITKEIERLKKEIERLTSRTTYLTNKATHAQSSSIAQKNLASDKKKTSDAEIAELEKQAADLEVAAEKEAQELEQQAQEFAGKAALIETQLNTKKAALTLQSTKLTEKTEPNKAAETKETVVQPSTQNQSPTTQTKQFVFPATNHKPETTIRVRQINTKKIIPPVEVSDNDNLTKRIFQEMKAILGPKGVEAFMTPIDEAPEKYFEGNKEGTLYKFAKKQPNVHILGQIAEHSEEYYKKMGMSDSVLSSLRKDLFKANGLTLGLRDQALDIIKAKSNEVASTQNKYKNLFGG